MQSESNSTDPRSNRQVELRIVDPQLRHRIARALQRAGVGGSAVDGPIRVALRRPSFDDPTNGIGRMIELSGESRTQTQHLHEGDERIESVLRALENTPFARRTAGRIDPAGDLSLVVGETTLGVLASVRRAAPDASVVRGSRGCELDADTLERLLSGVGTLVIGEVDQLSPECQALVQRLLAAREVSVALIASTARDLSVLADAGQFDADLASRLLARAITIDPLRRRRDDLASLTEVLLAHFCRQFDRTSIPALTDEAVTALRSHHWPGGIDELADTLERAALLSDGRVIALEDLPPNLHDGVTHGDPLLPTDWANRDLRDVRESAAAAAERAYLDAVLRHTRGVIKDAAKMCGIGPRSLYDRMQQHHLRKEDYRR
ncbi:MAG: helix-turn-helix domain-containing protein [Planctomycetota bacterium]